MVPCYYGLCVKALSYTQVNSTQIDKSEHTPSPLPINVGPEFPPKTEGIYQHTSILANRLIRQRDTFTLYPYLS